MSQMSQILPDFQVFLYSFFTGGDQSENRARFATFATFATFLGYLFGATFFEAIFFSIFSLFFSLNKEKE